MVALCDRKSLVRDPTLIKDGLERGDRVGEPLRSREARRESGDGKMRLEDDESRVTGVDRLLQEAGDLAVSRPGRHVALELCVIVLDVEMGDEVPQAGPRLVNRLPDLDVIGRVEGMPQRRRI